MTIKKLAKLYDNNSVSVCGKKGRGKDLLIANVIARRKSKYYISNVDYKVPNKTWIRFIPDKLRTGNDYRDFLADKTKAYIYPYPDGTDIYISDCGVYFPSQYTNELNRDYKDIPTFMALSRQLGDCYVHTNAQTLNRVWDKIREQSDIYIDCQWCKYIKIFKWSFVLQKVRLYERYDSAVNSVPPCRIKVPLFDPDRKQNAIIERERYTTNYGNIKSRILIYRNKSSYDTRLFKTILEGGTEYD